MDNWLDAYLNNPKDTVIELNLDYYNSVFHKLLFIFLKRSKSILEKDKKLSIKWHHSAGDEDSLDACNNFTNNINYPIEQVVLD